MNISQLATNKLQTSIGALVMENTRLAAMVEISAHVKARPLPPDLAAAITRLSSLKPVAGDLVFAIEALERAWCDAQPPREDEAP